VSLSDKLPGWVCRAHLAASSRRSSATFPATATPRNNPAAGPATLHSVCSNSASSASTRSDF